MYLFGGCAGIAALAAQGVQPLVRNVVTQAPEFLMLSAVRGQAPQDARYMVFRLCIEVRPIRVLG